MKNVIGTAHYPVFHLLELIPKTFGFLNCYFSHTHYLSYNQGAILARVPINAKTMKNPKWMYQQFMNLEERAAAIYVQMASRFSPQDPELSSFWLDMAMQEKQHAGLLQFCIAEELYSPDLPPDKALQETGVLFDNLFKRASEPDLTASDSFHIAIQLETSEANAIYDRLTTPVHSSMYLLRRKVATMLPDHLGRLLIEARKRNIPQETLKELEGTASRHEAE